jgi:hypothetical protein
VKEWGEGGDRIHSKERKRKEEGIPEITQRKLKVTVRR